MSSRTAKADTMWASIKNLFGASWLATQGDRVRFTTFCVLYVFAYATEFAVPVVIGMLLDVFVKKGLTSEAFNQAVWWIAAYVGLKVIHALMHHYARYLQGGCAYRARLWKLEEVFSAFMSFPLKWHVHHHSGENLSRLNRSVSAIEAVIGNYLWQIIDGMVRLFASTILIFWLDPIVGFAVLLMGCGSTGLMLLFNSRLTRNIRKMNRFNDRLHRTCVDYLFNIITVKTLHLEEPAVRYLTAHKSDGERLTKKIWKYQELKWGSIDIGYSLVIGLSLLLYFYGHTSAGGTFSIAPVYVLMDYLNRAFGSITAFTGYYSGVMESAIAYDDASSVLVEAKAFNAPPAPSRVPRDWEVLKLANVRFSYDGQTDNLKSIMLDIKRGQKIALVGPSGGGKSTLLKVLAGMLHVSEASVRVGTTELSVDDIAGVSLLIPQEPQIFSETVRYNLTLGQEYSDRELTRALQLCSIDHLLERLPNGWDSDLEEAGLNISVGERQRMALARGVLRVRGKDLLLLDEPTSSLDPLTEKKIFDSILSEFADRTIMMACHRLALAPLFDRIIYVRDGRIEEDGTFTELKTGSGPFSLAWADFERNLVVNESVS